MKKTTNLLLGCAMLLAATLAGCSLSKPYPAKQLYALDPGAPEPAGSATPGSTLRVPRARVAEPFSKSTFHSLVGPGRFEEDYYASFVAEPDRLITGELIDWLSATGLYQAVVDASSTVDAPRSLQCMVSELYCDRTDPAAPRAVISARFILLDERQVAASVVFSHDYHASGPVNGSDADAIAQAWGIALRSILEQVTADLQSAR